MKTPKEFVNEKLGDKHYTHSKYPIHRREIEKWLAEYAEVVAKNLQQPDVIKSVCLHQWNLIKYGLDNTMLKCKLCGEERK